MIFCEPFSPVRHFMDMNVKHLLALPLFLVAFACAADGPYHAPNGKAFPEEWGEPPRRQTEDLRPLPGGYGKGSGTLARWIKQNLDKDAAAAAKPGPLPVPEEPAEKPPKKKGFPRHWGEQPMIQTRDYRKLPGGYGFGSGTLAKWIQKNLDADAKAEAERKEKPDEGTTGAGKAGAKEMTVKKAKGLVAHNEKEIVEIKDFMSRARLTPKGYQAKVAEIEKREKRIAELKQWIADH